MDNESKSRKQFSIYRNEYFKLRKKKRLLNAEIRKWEKEVDRIERGVAVLVAERCQIVEIMGGLNYLMNLESAKFDPTGEEAFNEAVQEQTKRTPKEREG